MYNCKLELIIYFFIGRQNSSWDYQHIQDISKNIGSINYFYFLGNNCWDILTSMPLHKMLPNIMYNFYGYSSNKIRQIK